MLNSTLSAANRALLFRGMLSVFLTAPLSIYADVVALPTTAELTAVRNGLQALSAELPLISGGSSSVVFVISNNGQWRWWNPPYVAVNTDRWYPTRYAARDADLGRSGDIVYLKAERLAINDSFETSRDFVVGKSSPSAPSGSNGVLMFFDDAAIDTRSYDLSVHGRITAYAPLHKEGSGTLLLTGQNAWQGNSVTVENGTLKGNTASLATSIHLASTPSRVEFAQSSDGSYGDIVSGYGDLIKSGTGVLTLTRAQSYYGATHIVDGSLALLGQGSLSHQTLVDVAQGAIFDVSGVNTRPIIGGLSGEGDVLIGKAGLSIQPFMLTTTFAGRITGEGSLSVARAEGTVWRDDGTQIAAVASGLVLSGENDYRGETYVGSQASLALKGRGSLRPDAALSLYGTLDISEADGDRRIGALAGGDSGRVVLGNRTLEIRSEPNGFAYFEGVVSGTGGITKTGSGRLELSGRNTYTGTTRILEGTLRARPRSISPNVVNHATLELYEPDSDSYADVSGIGAYSGNIFGSGRVVKTGEGIVWLRGHNSYTGGTRVIEGTLVGNSQSLPGNVVVERDAGIGFYVIGSDTFAGQVSGEGTLYSYGPGVLTLTGKNTHTRGARQ